MLAAPNGPRVAVLEIGGWDTHAAQLKRLQQQLDILDASIAALHTNLGDAWRDTVVLTVTEFGRTARINGTKGTDHGTAGVAMLLGGAVPAAACARTGRPGQRPAVRGSRPDAHLRRARHRQGRAGGAPGAERGCFAAGVSG